MTTQAPYDTTTKNVCVSIGLSLERRKNINSTYLVQRCLDRLLAPNDAFLCKSPSVYGRDNAPLRTERCLFLCVHLFNAVTFV